MDALGSRDPHRLARPRGRAHPSARQRGDQRGVDLRQDPPRRRRPEDAAPRPALRAGRRQAEAGELAEAFAADRRQGEGDRRRRRIGAIAGDLASVEEMFALKGLMDKLGSPNIDCRQDGSKLHPKFGRASYLFNSTVAGIDAGRRDPDRRLQSAPRIAGAQRPHPQALAEGRLPDRRDRRAGRPHLRLQLSRRRAGDAGRASPSIRRRTRTKPMFIVGAGAFARPDGAAVLALAAKAARRSASSRTAGTASTCCTPPPPASAASISASCRARAASTRRRWPRRARSTCCSISAPTRSTSSPAPSSSTSARTATAARIAPTSSCRAPPTPRRPASTSTPRAGRSSPSAPCSRRATRARTGRSCARCRTRWARGCPTTR